MQTFSIVPLWAHGHRVHPNPDLSWLQKTAPHSFISNDFSLAMNKFCKLRYSTDPLLRPQISKYPETFNPNALETPAFSF